jgi:hypothetical protein
MEDTEMSVFSKSGWKSVSIWFAFCVMLPIVGCSNGQEPHQLCGKFKIARCNPYEVRIFREDDHDQSGEVMPAKMVDGSVEKFAVKAPYITGFTILSKLDPRLETHCGYFLINANSDDLKEGLTEQEWRRELELIGWKNPNLQEP